MRTLNRKATKTYAIRLSGMTGRNFTRVSKNFLDRIESKLNTLIAAEVHAACSGKTLA